MTAAWRLLEYFPKSATYKESPERKAFLGFYIPDCEPRVIPEGAYSALMQCAEEATYAEFERLKHEVIEPSLSCHDGRLIKTTGDGALAEFASPSAAVRCAVEIQESIASGQSSLKLRIGVNLGEVIVGADGDLFGDGINIAVRLEGTADPGGILISEKVYSEVDGKLDGRGPSEFGRKWQDREDLARGWRLRRAARVRLRLQAQGRSLGTIRCGC
jgi:class 3 adenylate cyclase